MGRYIFTEQDFEPFRAFLDHPIAQQVLESAIPIKQLVDPVIHVEEAGVPLAVDVRSQDNPQGVPLHEVLAAVQEHVPEVQGMLIRNNTVVLTHSQPPTAEARGKIDSILKDTALLESLKPPPAESPSAASLTESAAPDPLAQKLADTSLSDQDWIKAFREYAVKNLLKGAR